MFFLQSMTLSWPLIQRGQMKAELQVFLKNKKGYVVNDVSCKRAKS
jgi:hypothetical protein